jgi:hypothetical protein
VTTAKDAVFSLKFKGSEPPEFNVRHNQRPLTLPQKQFFNAKLDELVEAKIIAPISPNEVKFVAPQSWPRRPTTAVDYPSKRSYIE